MATIQEIRAKYPGYEDLSDEQLAQALHRKYYADVPFDRFAQKIGLQGGQSPAEAPANERRSFGEVAQQAFELNPFVMAYRSAPAVAKAARGDAAEDLPSAVGHPAFGEAKDVSVQEVSAAVFGNDQDLGLAMANKVPGSKLDQDANGNVVIELPTGERVYPNQPGLDTQDVIRFGGNALAYLPSARAAQLAGNLIPRAITMAGLTGATNLGGQAAAGREELDLLEAGLTGSFGAAGEFAAPVAGWIAKLSRSSKLKGEARAAQILRAELGVEQPTVGQVKSFSQALDEIDAGADPVAILGADEFGFIYTKGRRLRDGDPSKFGVLTREEALRQDPGMAGNAMRSVDDQNQAALDAVVGRLTRPGDVGPQTPVQAFEQIGERVGQMADRLRGRVSGAYDKAAESGRAVVAADAVRQVPGRLQAALREFPSDPRLTPATRSMLDEIAKKAGQLQQGTKGVTLRAIEEQRRVINNAYGAAANPTDQAALRVLKAEYDRWLDDAIDNALLTGDPEALAAIKEARALRTEFGRRFEGNADVDRFIARMIEGEKTPEELIGAALGASQVSKAGAARFIERLRTASGADPEVMGALKAAHLMRLLQNKDGGTLSMATIRSNILTAERETPSVIRSLYGDAEWAQVKRLAQSLEPLIDRGTFARRPGTADQLLRQMMSLPFIGRAVEAVRQPVNIGRAYRATGPLASPKGPAGVAAGAAAAGAELEQGRDG